jgi:putative DNA primase/helicase
MSRDIEGVYNFLKSNGYSITHDLVLDDKPHDYKKDGYKFWYIGTVSQEGVTFTFEDYTKNNGRLHYRSNKHVMYGASHLTRSLQSEDLDSEKSDNGAFQKSIEEKKIAQEQEKKEANKLAAIEAKKMMGKTKEFIDEKILSPYLVKKGFNFVGSGAQLIDENGNIELIIPIQNSLGEIVNVQRILYDGKKLFLKGGQKKECYHVIEPTNQSDTENDVTYLTEGYATGLSINMATKKRVIVCFDAGNMRAISKILNKTNTIYAVAADDDHKNEVNTGVLAAKEAVQNLINIDVNAYLCIPKFGAERKESDTDWNDLHLGAGVQEVESQLNQYHQEFLKRLNTNNQVDENNENLEKNIDKRISITIHPRINIQAPDSYYDLWEKANLSLGRGKTPLYNYENVLKIFTTYSPLQELVWYDEFHQKYLTKSTSDGKIREWRDNDDLALTAFFQEHIGFKLISDSAISKAVTLFADKNVKNEPKDWMNSLEWDGINRCENFFIQATQATNSKYVRAVGKNWWITLAARVYKPGCKVDNMLILEGPQGAYKSELLKVVAGPWFGEGSESLVNKDFYENLKGKLIYEIGELDQFNKSETTTIKRVITCQVDRYRKAYGRKAEDNPRTSVFVGTTNEDEYLKDSTGGRRFWPILVKKIDLAYVRGARNQLFAEAVARFKRGENWWEMPEIETKEQQEERRIRDSLEEVLITKLRAKREYTINEISEAAFGADSIPLKMPDQFRLGRALRAIGWEKIRARRDAGMVVIWKNTKDESSLLS